MDKQALKGKVFKCLLNDDVAVFRSYLEFVCLNMVNDYRNSQIVGTIDSNKRTSHHLITAKEMDVLAVMLYNRWNLSFVIKNDDVLNETVSNNSARQKVRRQLGITQARFGEIIRRLDKASLLIPVWRDDGKIEYYRFHEKFIPQVYRDEKGKLCCTMRFILRSENNGEAST